MNINKVITTIAGFSPCSEFSYACFIAENLSNVLPNYSIRIIVKSSADWKDWLEKKCNENKWHHDSSPLIWRESGVCGSKPVYIGGDSEYKKFIHDYYGIDVALTENEIINMNLDYNFVQDLVLKKEFKKSKSDRLNIAILGAGRSVCPDLVAQLATLKEFGKVGIVINLYDDPGHFFKLKDIVKDAISVGGDLCSINNCENLSDALKYCNILIVLDYIVREEFEYESTSEWLNKNYKSSKNLAEQLNSYAPSDVKVILCSTGPTCFCANVIVKYATKINKNQIVAISAHYALEMMYVLAKSLDIDLKGVGCSPVWGFLGISQYIDIFHTLQKCSVCIPNERALSRGNSSLTLGSKYTEFRWLMYLTFNKHPHDELNKRKSKCLYQVGRSEDFQKCKAICDLLKIWCRNDETNIEDEIITLGISSDGTFGIAKDVYFSQPVHLKILDDKSRVWIPCSEFPFPVDRPDIIVNLMDTAKMILQSTNLIDQL